MPRFPEYEMRAMRELADAAIEPLGDPPPPGCYHQHDETTCRRARTRLNAILALMLPLGAFEALTERDSDWPEIAEYRYSCIIREFPLLLTHWHRMLLIDWKTFREYYSRFDKALANGLVTEAGVPVDKLTTVPDTAARQRRIILE